MTKKIAAIEIPEDIPDEPWMHGYRREENWLVGGKNEYISEEDLTALKLKDIECNIRYASEQAKWGEATWPVPESFSDYRNED